VPPSGVAISNLGEIGVREFREGFGLQLSLDSQPKVTRKRLHIAEVEGLLSA